uniref:Uncharacterized protein n=1 Tax=Sus scrofa TaxID=9823 RepID=A0A4X1W4P5_PIG
LRARGGRRDRREGTWEGIRGRRAPAGGSTAGEPQPPSRNRLAGQQGLPDELIQKGKDIKGTSEIVQNGKHFKLTITTGSKVVQNEFTLGEECEMETLTGEKVKTVVQLEGDNKLVTTFKGIKSVTELNGDIITSVSWCPELVTPSAGGGGWGEREGSQCPLICPWLLSLPSLAWEAGWGISLAS